jgi:hypothetical protein
MALFSSPGLNSVPTTSTQQDVSKPFQPYVSDLLNKTQALTDAGIPAYTGQMTSGPSTLQNQAWQGLASLTVPTALQNAGSNLDAISKAEAGLDFKPQEFTNTYNAPSAYQGTNFTNQYQGTTPYQASDISNQYNAAPAYQSTNFGNQYQAAAPYQASNIQSTYQSPSAQYAPTNVTTGSFNQQAAEQYMNPYIQQALNPQLEALKRQQQINQQADMAKLTQAGAFGGSRQAVLQGQNNYNLLAQQANLIGQGYNQAYQQAGQQFTADQARALQAQQANVQQAQFAAQQGMTDAQLKAQYGMTAAQANEASKQFAQNQAATAAQLQAQYGLSGQQATEASKQFAQNQAATAAQLQAQYGMSAEQANETSRQFAQSQSANAAQLMAQYGLSAQQANEATKQFGYGQQMTQAQLKSAAEQAKQAAQENAAQFQATYGLQGLQAAQQAQTAAANAGAQASQYGLANLQALSTAGGQQQALNQAALNAQYNEFLRQQKAPQDLLTLQKNILSGLPITTTNQYGAAQSTAQKIAGGVSGAIDMVSKLKGLGYPPDKIASYIKDMFKDTTGKPLLDDKAVQDELDRVAASQSKYLPEGAKEDGQGGYYRDDNGVRTYYDAEGQTTGAEATPDE